MSEAVRELYSYAMGEGPEVVMLHGWGMHSGIWRELAEALAQDFRVTCVDLPGHGLSPRDLRLNVQDVIDALLEIQPQASHWIGWSLGGHILMQLAAQAPQCVQSLGLICSSPRYTKSPDWAFAMDAAILEQFASELEQNYQQTLLRFIALQTLSSSSAHATLKILRQRIRESDMPGIQALRDGLDILRHGDARSVLADLQCRTQVILGERDTIVPANIARYYRDIPAVQQVHTINGAGHAPFLSHPGSIYPLLRDFLLDTPNQLPESCLS